MGPGVPSPPWASGSSPTWPQPFQRGLVLPVKAWEILVALPVSCPSCPDPRTLYLCWVLWVSPQTMGTVSRTPLSTRHGPPLKLTLCSWRLGGIARALLPASCMALSAWMGIEPSAQTLGAWDCLESCLHDLVRTSLWSPCKCLPCKRERSPIPEPISQPRPPCPTVRFWRWMLLLLGPSCWLP